MTPPIPKTYNFRRFYPSTTHLIKAGFDTAKWKAMRKDFLKSILKCAIEENSEIKTMLTTIDTFGTCQSWMSKSKIIHPHSQLVYHVICSGLCFLSFLRGWRLWKFDGWRNPSFWRHNYGTLSACVTLLGLQRMSSWGFKATLYTRVILIKVFHRSWFAASAFLRRTLIWTLCCRVAP